MVVLVAVLEEEVSVVDLAVVSAAADLVAVVPEVVGSLILKNVCN